MQGVDYTGAVGARVDIGSDTMKACKISESAAHFNMSIELKGCYSQNNIKSFNKNINCSLLHTNYINCMMDILNY